MSRIMVIFTLCFMVSGLLASDQQLNLNLRGSGILPAGGDFGPNTQSTDVLKTGSDLALSGHYFLKGGLGIQAGYDLGWMNFESKYRPSGAKSPAFVVHQITLGGVYNFRDFMSKRSRIQPLIGAGVGLYPFRATDDGLTGETLKAATGKAFKKAAFGLNSNAGISIRATRKLSILGEARFNHIFSEDREKFGKDFGNQSLLSFGLGLSYRII